MCLLIVVQNKVFIGIIDDDKVKKCYVKVYDVIIGYFCWIFVIFNLIKNIIVYEDGCIFVLDVLGMFYVIDVEKGIVCW